MAGKKIKLDKEAINETLVADTDSESGSEASDFEDYFEEEEEEEDHHHQQQQQQQQQQRQQQQQQQASAEIKTQAATSGRLPTWGLPQGRNFSSFCQTSKRCEKKWGSTHRRRQLTIVCVDAVFHRNFSYAG